MQDRDKGVKSINGLQDLAELKKSWSCETPGSKLAINGEAKIRRLNSGHS